MPDQSDQGRDQKANEAGPARLFALCAGGFLALLGVLGFFFDAGFETGKQLSADDVAGIIVVNGWRNVLYLVTGLLALGFAARRPRRTAAVLGGFYLLLGLWGVAETDHDIGNILEVLPLTDEDNVFHLALGALGVVAALADGPLPKARPAKPRRRRPKPEPDAEAKPDAAAKEKPKPEPKRPATSRSRA
jgi:hypothetical protein